MTSKTKALLTVTLAYVVTAVLGILTYQWASGSTWVRVLYADIAMTVWIYAVSVFTRNSSSYDPFWSLIPVYFVGGLMLIEPQVTTPMWTKLIVSLVVTLWGLRLTWNWARGWPGWEHEDWRYVDFRSSHGRLFEFTNFFGIHLVPTLMVYLGCLPFFWIFGHFDGLTSPQAVSLSPAILMSVGVAISFAGVAFEWVADNALADFRKRPSPKSTDILQTGIWGVIRHPNYLGELLFWIGIAVSGLAAGAPLWSVAGAVVMIVLFVFISIPLKERRMEKGRPDWAEHRRRVRALIPGVY